MVWWCLCRIDNLSHPPFVDVLFRQHFFLTLFAWFLSALPLIRAVEKDKTLSFFLLYSMWKWNTIWCGIQPALAYSSHRWNSFCFSKIQQYKDSNSDDDFDVQFFNHTFFTPETWMNAILMCLFVASLSVANFNLL